MAYPSVFVACLAIAVGEHARRSSTVDADAWPGDFDLDVGGDSGALSLLQLKLENRRIQTTESGQIQLGSFSRQEGHVQPFGAELAVKMMTLEQAKAECINLAGCTGFAAKGDASDTGPLEIHFKKEWGSSSGDWTSFSLGGTSDSASQPVAALLSTSSSRKLQRDADYRFEAVDGGQGRACRASGVTDSKPEYYSAAEAASFEDCQEACVANDRCSGVEYNSQSKRCKVWTSGIGSSARATRFFQCHRLVRLRHTSQSDSEHATDRETSLLGTDAELMDAGGTSGNRPLGPLLQLVEDGHITTDMILERATKEAILASHPTSEA